MFISYNLLNLPTEIYTYADFWNWYGYLADGTKIQHETWDRQYMYYGSLVYNNGQFESASFGGGRIVGTYDDSDAHYFLTDHLGSTRVVAKVTPTGREDLDRKDYYPFGKTWKQPLHFFGGGRPWYPCPTMPISGYGSTINNLRSRLRCAVLSDSGRSPSR